MGEALAAALHRAHGLRRVQHGSGGLADRSSGFLAAAPRSRGAAASDLARPHRAPRTRGVARAQWSKSELTLALRVSACLHRVVRRAPLPLAPRERIQG